MRKRKRDIEKLEGLMAEIDAAYEDSSDNGVCLSPLLGDNGNIIDSTNASEGDDYDELL